MLQLFHCDSKICPVLHPLVLKLSNSLRNRLVQNPVALRIFLLEIACGRERERIATVLQLSASISAPIVTISHQRSASRSEVRLAVLPNCRSYQGRIHIPTRALGSCSHAFRLPTTAEHVDIVLLYGKISEAVICIQSMLLNIS